MSVGLSKLQTTITQEADRKIECAKTSTRSLAEIKQHASRFASLFDKRENREFPKIDEIVANSGGCVSLHAAFEIYSRRPHFKSPKVWLQELQTSLHPDLEIHANVVIHKSFNEKLIKTVSAKSGSTVARLAALLNCEISAVRVAAELLEKRGLLWRDESIHGICYFTCP